MDTVERRIRQIVALCWEVPWPTSKALVHALTRSDVDRARALRHHLATLDMQFATGDRRQGADAPHVFSETLTPRFLVDLLADLRATGALTGPQVRVIERGVLRMVDRTGQWKAG